jgi:hypothetical protein
LAATTAGEKACLLAGAWVAQLADAMVCKMAVRWAVTKAGERACLLAGAWVAQLAYWLALWMVGKKAGWMDSTMAARWAGLSAVLMVG